MSTEQGNSVGAENTGGVVLELDPTDILLPDETNVRPFSTRNQGNEAELEELTRLAQSIEEEGQIQPVVVVKNIAMGGPQYSLVAGRRRVAAIKMHNLGSDTQLKVKAVVAPIKLDKTRTQHMYRQAAHENIQRRNLNAMDFAVNIATTRAKFGEKGKGAKGTQKLAEFFKVSPATITQHEKLLTLPDDVQELVAAGELSNDAALNLVKVDADKRGEVVEKAKEHQATEQNPTDRYIELIDSRDGSTIPETADQPAAPKRGRKARTTKALKAKHVKKAIREVTGQNTKRSRAEVLEFFQSQLGPTNGHPNGAIHMFCNGLLEWAEGKVSDKALNKLWDKMTEKSDRGKPEPKKDVTKLDSKVAPRATQGRSGSAGKPAPKKAAKKRAKHAPKK